MSSATYRDIGTTPSRGNVPHVPCPGTGDIAGHVPDVPDVPPASVIDRSATLSSDKLASINVHQCRKAKAAEFKHRLCDGPSFEDSFTLVLRWIDDLRLALDPCWTRRFARHRPKNVVIAIAVLDVSAIAIDPCFPVAHCISRLLKNALCLSAVHVCRVCHDRQDVDHGGRGISAASSFPCRCRVGPKTPTTPSEGVGLAGPSPIPNRKIPGSLSARHHPRVKRDFDRSVGADFETR